ncbi:hypothetical protein M0Q50_02390 [bacterium]|jgi:hypothetical protein|nr:hypothetical protein [bacterium]
MKTFESFNMDPREKLFLELTHIDELEIKFDFINETDILRLEEKLFYFYKDDCIFSQYKNHNYLSINNMLWSYSHMEVYDNQLFVKSMLLKYLNISNYDIDYRVEYVNNQINNNFY